MMLLRPGTHVEEMLIGAGILCAVTGVAGLAVLFWWPLMSYSFHYWLGD